MRQAHQTAQVYLANVVRYLDDEFGRGYAKSHPDLVGQLVMAAAIDSGSTVVARAVENLGQSIENAANQLAPE